MTLLKPKAVTILFLVMVEMTPLILELEMTLLPGDLVMTPLTADLAVISQSSLVIRLIILSLHLSLVYLRRSQFQGQMEMILSPI